MVLGLPSPDDQRPLEVIRAQADAAVNRMAVIACDRTGTERGVNWVGGTVVTDPDSWVLAGGTTTADTHTAIVEVDLALDKCIGGLSDIHNAAPNSTAQSPTHTTLAAPSSGQVGITSATTCGKRGGYSSTRRS